MKFAFIIILALGGVSVLWSIFKTKHPVKSIITAVFQGITSMMAVNVLGLMTGVTIAVNWYTLLTVSIFGIPSVITLVLMDAFLI